MSAAFYQDEVKFYVAVDCIILGFNNKELNVLLYKRSFEPMKGQWSLMGGFVKSGESVETIWNALFHSWASALFPSTTAMTVTITKAQRAVWKWLCAASSTPHTAKTFP